MASYTCYCNITIIEVLRACAPITTQYPQGSITGYTFLRRCHASKAGIRAREAELFRAIIEEVIRADALACRVQYSISSRIARNARRRSTAAQAIIKASSTYSTYIEIRIRAWTSIGRRKLSHECRATRCASCSICACEAFGQAR